MTDEGGHSTRSDMYSTKFSENYGSPCSKKVFALNDAHMRTGFIYKTGCRSEWIRVFAKFLKWKSEYSESKSIYDC